MLLTVVVTFSVATVVTFAVAVVVTFVVDSAVAFVGVIPVVIVFDTTVAIDAAIVCRCYRQSCSLCIVTKLALLPIK